MVYDRGTCLLVEGLSLEIVDDSSWKKPEEIKKEIREKYQEYRTEKGREPHFLECIIRWNDTLETLETRITLDMDSDTEMDEEIFFYCDTLDSLLSLADNSGEDFVIAGYFGSGLYCFIVFESSTIVPKKSSAQYALTPIPYFSATSG